MTEDHGPGDVPKSDTAPQFGADVYRRFYHQSAVPTLTLDLARRAILECNQAALDFLQRPRDEVIGHAAAEFLAEPTPDDALRLRGLRGESTRTIRNVNTARGVRITEVTMVQSGTEGIVFIQTHDLTDVLDANAILERRTSELQVQTDALESLSARIAHDLRGPLATIAGFVDLLRDHADTYPPEQREAILERIGKNARSLAKMIGDMLDEAMLSEERADDGSTRVADLFTTLRSIYDVELFAVGGELETRTTVEQLPVPLALVRQPLVNLIGNSIKYRDLTRPLVVAVDVATDEDDTTITVRDNGTGIDDVDAIFEMGVRGDNADATEGSGMGLAHSREALEALGGSLVAIADDRGARFQIRLPSVAEVKVETREAFGGSYAAGLTARQLDRILQLAPTPTLLIDLAARSIVRVNEAAERALGLPAEQIVGRRGREFLVDPDDGDALRSDVLIQGNERAGTVTTLRTARGDVQVEVGMAAIEDTTLSFVQFHPLHR